MYLWLCHFLLTKHLSQYISLEQLWILLSWHNIASTMRIHFSTCNIHYFESINWRISFIICIQLTQISKLNISISLNYMSWLTMLSIFVNMTVQIMWILNIVRSLTNTWWRSFTIKWTNERTFKNSCLITTFII